MMFVQIAPEMDCPMEPPILVKRPSRARTTATSLCGTADMAASCSVITSVPPEMEFRAWVITMRLTDVPGWRKWMRRNVDRADIGTAVRPSHLKRPVWRIMMPATGAHKEAPTVKMLVM